jgi:electron transport complex protein RnfG
MRDILRFGATLTIVALIATGSLAWINKITRPRILLQQENELNDGLYTVLPNTDKGKIEPVIEGDVTLYYEGYADKAKSEFIGYAFLALGTGYSSTIRTLVGIDKAGAILGIKILFQQETPGLGTRCEEIRSGETTPWWQDQFIRKPSLGIAVDKDNGEIESITGATITSRAITNSIAEQAKKVLDRINETHP